MQSPPLIERLRQMMNDSDNVMAESIGREVAAEQNRPQSFDGAVQAVLGQLDKAKIDTGNARLLDSSGLSVDDRLTAETLDGVVNAAAGSDQPKLRPLLDLLPIAGGSGTLSNRYLDTDAGRAAAGIPAGQDRIADRHQLAGRHRHRCERAGAHVRVHLQQRRADGPHGDRRAGRRAAIVRVQHMSTRRRPRVRIAARVTSEDRSEWESRHEPSHQVQAHRRPRRRLAVRRDRRRQAVRPGPAATDYTRSQVIDQLAEASRNAELPVRDVTGLNEGGEIPEARIVDRVEWIRAATQSMRVMTGGSEQNAAKPRFITGRITGAQTGAVLAFVSSGILGQYDPFAAERRRAAAGVPERDRRRAPIAGAASRFPAVGVPARGHPPGAVPGQPWLADHMSQALAVLTEDAGEDVGEVVGRLAELRPQQA